MTSTTMTLTTDTPSIEIHGTTGQHLTEGTLAAGTLVRSVREHDDGDGPVTRYQASADGGSTWYEQLTHGRVAVSGGRRVEVRDDLGELVYVDVVSE